MVGLPPKIPESLETSIGTICRRNGVDILRDIKVLFVANPKVYWAILYSSGVPTKGLKSAQRISANCKRLLFGLAALRRSRCS